MFGRFLRTAYHASFRALLPLRYALADRRLEKNSGMPPAKLRFRVCESLSIPVFLSVGERCAMLLREAGLDLAATGRVLDFGCGCGRTMRWLVNDSSAELHGVDVDKEAIAWCRDHIPQGKFAVNDPEPPLPFPDEHFEAVYCLSVFTHLSEPMQDRWFDELRRVLVPGGLLIVTVHGAAAAAQMKPEIREELNRNGFVHKRSRKLQGILPDWYHTTLHTPDYIRQRLAAHGFGDIRYEVVSDGIQDVVTARALQPGHPHSSTGIQTEAVPASH